MLISIEQMVHHQQRTESHIKQIAETQLPTRFDNFTTMSYQIAIDDSKHVALVYGDPTELIADTPILTQMHSECLTNDVFSSSRYDCDPQLDKAIKRIVTKKRDVIVYLHKHENRKIKLLAKLQTYQLQDNNRDTIDANLDLELPADAQHYGAATQILKDLNVTSVRLLTNNPAKTQKLKAYSVPIIERVPLTPHPNDHNLAYLQTKRDRINHDIGNLPNLSVITSNASSTPSKKDPS